MSERTSAALRAGRRVVDACDRPSVFAAATLLTTGIAVLFGMAGKGKPFGVFVFGAALLGVFGFLRYVWTPVQRFHERREPDERDPTSMRFEGFSADTRVFLTFLAAITLVTLGLILLDLYVG